MSDASQAIQRIYAPRADGPMRVVFFASGGPGNICAAFDAQDLLPEELQIGLVVTDRLDIPAIAVAQARGVPVLSRDFERQCGSWRECRGNAQAEFEYRRRAREFHDEVAAEICRFEQERGWRFDLAVLAYRRIVEGALLERFSGQMINQHPADLSVLTGRAVRAYTGIGGHARALEAGAAGGRTSTILVRAQVDAGEVLCQGPWVPYAGDGSESSIRRHEDAQKAMSDWPALRFTLAAIALGHFGLGPQVHHDGNHVVFFGSRALPYWGVRCDAGSYLRLLLSEGRLASARSSAAFVAKIVS